MERLVVMDPSFSERMASIKSMFKTAHENASNLHAEMESEIANCCIAGGHQNY